MKSFFRQIKWFIWCSRLEVMSIQSPPKKSIICKMCKICLFEHKIIILFSFSTYLPERNNICMKNAILRNFSIKSGSEMAKNWPKLGKNGRKQHF